MTRPDKDVTYWQAAWPNHEIREKLEDYYGLTVGDYLFLDFEPMLFDDQVKVTARFKPFEDK